MFKNSKSNRNTGNSDQKHAFKNFVLKWTKK